MRKKYQIVLRTLMLIFISCGVFISSFHSHSDLQWSHTTSHCQTDTHLSGSEINCPVCGFRLKAAFTADSTFEAFETVSETIIPESEAQINNPFNGQTTGRSPPALA